MAITYEPIATETASGSVSSITFSSISGTYTDLVIIVNGGTAGSDNSLVVRFNSDTGGNYSYTAIDGDGSGSSALASNNTNTSAGYAGRVGSNGSASIHHIMNYSNATTYKTAISRVIMQTV
jgi:hypothetical protein